MARDDAMHLRLLNWAQWLLVGDGSGFPTMSVMHPEWMPPTPGLTPTLKASSASREVLDTQHAVRGLSERLQATLLLVYCYPSLSQAERAQRLGIAERTVDERIDTAHGLLRQALAGVWN